MRIIAGRFKRRVLSSPRGNGIRPSTDRTREAMFNLLVSRVDLSDSQVLDLFCGTGALGLEALSRGAEAAIFVDNNRDALATARSNSDSLDCGIISRFVLADVFSWLKTQPQKSYRLILADPPYVISAAAELIDLALPLLMEDGVFVFEHDRKIKLDDHPCCIVSRRYGRSVVSIFAPPSSSFG